MIDTGERISGKGDKIFGQFEYWGLGNYFIVHYVGDETVFKGFEHRNSKQNVKPFIRSAPHVKFIDLLKIAWIFELFFYFRF